MARVLIAGCGDIGVRLGLLLARAGHRVWGLRRHPHRLPAPIRPLAADLGDATSLSALPEADVVYYTAAAGAYDPHRYRQVYDEGVARLLDALSGAGRGPRRVFLTSSTSVYGDAGGRWVDEHTPARGEGFAADSLRAGERRLWDGPYPATIVRFAGIYGPGRTRLLDSLRAGRARCTRDVYSNRIHSDDCAGFLAHLFDAEQPDELYLGVDDAPTPLCEVLAWLAGELGVPGPVEQPERGAASGVRGGNKRCRNARLRHSGYRLRYPSFREGYAALLAAGA